LISKSGLSLLHKAASLGNLNVIKCIWKSPSDLLLENNQHITALYCAASNNRINILLSYFMTRETKMQGLFLSATPDQYNKYNEIAKVMIKNEYFDTLEKLIKLGLKLNASNIFLLPIKMAIDILSDNRKYPKLLINFDEINEVLDKASTIIKAGIKSIELLLET